MNQQQSKVIAVMLAVAILIAAIVLVRGGSQGAHDEHGEHGEQGEHAEREHADSHGEAEHVDDGVIHFTDRQIGVAGITLATAGPVHLDTFIRMPGQIALNEDRTAHVTPRAAGAVSDVNATLGEQVRRGQVLATIASADVAAQRGALAAAERRVTYARQHHAAERTLWEEKISARQDLLKAEQELREAEIMVESARQQLQALGARDGGRGGASNLLQVRAPFDGVIVEKHITHGEVVNADTRVFTLSDLSTVWADVVVPARDLDIVRVGTDAVIRSIASSTTAQGKVSFVSSLVGEASRSAKARVVLDNPGVAWRPGLAVNIDVVTGSSDVPVAVARAALQTVDGREVVFKRVKEGFIAQPVGVGRSDGRFVEITAGLSAGDAYAGAGSFAVKAEQGKGEAGHDH